MAESKSTSKSTSASEPGKTKDPNFVEEGEAAQEAGYWGKRENPFPDEDFTLTTGPDAPVQDAQGKPVED